MKPAAGFPSRKNKKGQLFLKSPCRACCGLPSEEPAQVRRPHFLSPESQAALEALLLQSSGLRAAILNKLELREELTPEETALRRDLWRNEANPKC